MKKWKQYSLFLLLLISGLLLTGAGFAGEHTIYADYSRPNGWMTPALSLVFQGVKDGVAPWELFPHKDPDIFRCTQGLEEFWSDHIFLPYWSQLSEKERNDLKRRAPSKAWLDWVEQGTTQENLLAIRAFHKRHGLPFDYRFYLGDFMLSYARDVQHFQDERRS